MHRLRSLARRSQLTLLSPPARDIADANKFGLITGTVSPPRTVELVLKGSSTP